MKKGIALLLAAVLACGVGAAVALSDTEQASAANVRNLEMTDSFNNSSLNTDAWSTTNGVARNREYSALRMNGINIWGSWIVLQEQQLSEDWDSFTIEMEMAWDGSTGWSGMFFGLESASGFFYNVTETNVPYFLQFHAGGQGESTEDGTTDRGLRLCRRDTSTNSGFYGTPEYTEFYACDVTEQGNLLTGGTVQRVVMEFNKQPQLSEDGETLYDLTFRWGDADGQAGENSITFTDGIAIGGYMGFSNYSGSNWEIRSFKLSTGTGSAAQTVVEDNFDSPSISYPAFSSTETRWRGVGDTAIEDRVYCGDFCNISYDNVANGSLVYAVPLARNAESERSFEMSYDITELENLSETTYLGSSFGLSGAAAEPDSADFIGIRKDADGYAAAYISKGTLVREYRGIQLSGGTVSLDFVGYSDGSVAMSVGGGEPYTFDGVTIDGYTAISALTLTENTPAQNACIDNVTLYVYDSLVSGAEDVGINFQGTSSTTTSFGDVFEDHYVNNRKWVMYGGVTLPRQVSNTFVVFDDISGDAAFLSRSQFGDHIARFDFKPSNLPDLYSDSGSMINYAGFGYSFGRTRADTSADDAPGVFFKRTGDEGAATVVANNMTTATGSSSVPCTLNVFKDTDTWYTCMVIISARTVKVFLKEASAPDSAFELQAKFTDVDTYGYAALTIQTSGDAYFYATNYSVTNIDPMNGREG